MEWSSRYNAQALKAPKISVPRRRRLALSRHQRGRLGALPAQPGTINAGLLDKYTIAHLGSGVAIQLFSKGRIGFWQTIAIAAGWEILEIGLKEWFPAVFYPYDTQDSLPNIATDIAAVGIGWWLASKLPDGAWL